MDLQRWNAADSSADRDLFAWFTLFPAARWRELIGDLPVSLAIGTDSGFRLYAHTSGQDRVLLAEGYGDTFIRNVDLVAGEVLAIDVDDPSLLREVIWSTQYDLELPGVIAVVPTFRRESDATHQSEVFLRSRLVNRVIVIGQGGTLQCHESFRALLDANPDRLELIEQGNFGGSGGYARGMIESLRDPHCAVLLSDDDAALPEESLRRMLVTQAFAARDGRRVLMATPMLSAEEPTRLISAAEWVEPRIFQWGAADGLRTPIDVAHDELGDALSIRHTPNYAGWWGALLPPGTVRDVGLPAPYFLKWDDAEYGLRATAKGYEVMALPGTGVWHPTWGAHKTLTTWVAVLLHRNRLATAAAYGAGRGVIRDSFTHQVKHVLSLQYDVAELWAAGIEQFSAGPEWLGTDLPVARERAQRVVDALPATAITGDVPAARPLRGVGQGLVSALTGLWRGSSSVDTSSPASDFTWRAGLGMDRVVLTDGDEIVAELRRDSRRARRLLRATIRQHLALARSWRALGPRYRDALTRSALPERWADMLGIEPDQTGYRD